MNFKTIKDHRNLKDSRSRKDHRNLSTQQPVQPVRVLKQGNIFFLPQTLNQEIAENFILFSMLLLVILTYLVFLENSPVNLQSKKAYFITSV